MEDNEELAFIKGKTYAFDDKRETFSEIGKHDMSEEEDFDKYFQLAQADYITCENTPSSDPIFKDNPNLGEKKLPLLPINYKTISYGDFSNDVPKSDSNEECKHEFKGFYHFVKDMDSMKKDEIYGFGKVLFVPRVTPRKCNDSDSATLIKNLIKKMNEEDSVNHPTHYGGEENPFEPIKIIEFYSLNFALGNVIKYVLRAGKKNDELEDLKKAHFYLGREIDKLSKL